MGFGGLIPAKELAAVYDPVKRILTLCAEGEAQRFTYGFNFHRENLLGGLKYSLQGWTGPVAKGLDPYKYEQVIKIQLLTEHYVVNSGYVTIVTANDLQGKLVKIRWLGLRDSGDLASEPITKDEVALKEKSQISSIPPNLEHSRPILVLFGTRFEVDDITEVSKTGGNTIKFDPTILTMVDAGNKHGKVFWEFNSLKAGDTQIEVTSSYDAGIMWTSRTVTYDVSIIVLPLGPLLPLNPSPNPIELPLSFLGNVNIAVEKVRKRYPKAELYEVDAHLPTNITPATIDPHDLTKLRAVFRNVNNSTVIIDSGSFWGTWEEPYLIEQPWLEDVAIPWPIKMDIAEAADLMRTAGFPEPFYDCTLRHPLGFGAPEDQEPCYIFQLDTTRFIFVGVNTHRVFESITSVLQFSGLNNKETNGEE